MSVTNIKNVSSNHNSLKFGKQTLSKYFCFAMLNPTHFLLLYKLYEKSQQHKK